MVAQTAQPPLARGPGRALVHVCVCPPENAWSRDLPAGRGAGDVPPGTTRAEVERYLAKRPQHYQGAVTHISDPGLLSGGRVTFRSSFKNTFFQKARVTSAFTV